MSPYDLLVVLLHFVPLAAAAAIRSLRERGAVAQSPRHTPLRPPRCRVRPAHTRLRVLVHRHKLRAPKTLTGAFHAAQLARFQRALAAFLLDAFTSADLLRLIEQTFAGLHLEREVSPNLDPRSFAFEIVTVLTRHGLLDEPLLHALTHARPFRQADLERLTWLLGQVHRCA